MLFILSVTGSSLPVLRGIFLFQNGAINISSTVCSLYAKLHLYIPLWSINMYCFKFCHSLLILSFCQKENLYKYFYGSLTVTSIIKSINPA